MSYSPVCSHKLYCVCWQTYLTLLFKSMCHHLKAVWKGPAPLQFPKKPKLVWVLCLSKETAFWVLPFLQSADFYPVCEMNVDMFPALVLLQSNDRSWLCPPSSLDALSIDLLGNLCFLKEHFKLLFFLLFSSLKLLSHFSPMGLPAFRWHSHKLALIAVPNVVPLPELVHNPPSSCMARFKLKS